MESQLTPHKLAKVSLSVIEHTSQSPLTPLFRAAARAAAAPSPPPPAPCAVACVPPACTLPETASDSSTASSSRQDAGRDE